MNINLDLNRLEFEEILAKLAIQLDRYDTAATPELRRGFAKLIEANPFEEISETILVTKWKELLIPKPKFTVVK